MTGLRVDPDLHGAKLLYATADAIELYPEHWDQGFWLVDKHSWDIGHLNVEDGYLAPDCGTTMCAAGWMGALTGIGPLDPHDGMPPERLAAIGRRAGLAPNAAEWLFVELGGFPPNEPGRFAHGLRQLGDAVVSLPEGRLLTVAEAQLAATALSRPTETAS